MENLKYAQINGKIAQDKSPDMSPAKNSKWFDKLSDSVKDFAVTLGRRACLVTPAVLVVATFGCADYVADLPANNEDTGANHYSPHENDGGKKDAGVKDGGVVDAGVQDSGVVDSGQEADTGVPDVGVPDAGVVDGGADGGYSLCGSSQNRKEILNLIGDYLDRSLGDRTPLSPTDSNCAYLLETAETSDNANPFSDGEGGTIGPNKPVLHRTDMVDKTVQDDSAGKTYSQKSFLWVSGSNHLDEGSNAVVADINFIAYSAKFSGRSDDFGIPVCTTPTNTDYTACKTDGVGGYLTERHKVKINFMGSDWVIAEMQPPAASVTTETKVLNGGYVVLAKESISGILNAAIQGDPQHQVGESLPVDNLKFRLDDVQDSQGTLSAIISVLDANDNVLKKDKVAEGATMEIQVNGKNYKLHVYKVANGYTFGAKWADVAIFSDEVKLQDGQQLDPDTQRFNGWTVALGWKNKGVSALDLLADHLRTIVVYSDEMSTVSSSADAKLMKGDFVKLPAGDLGFCYDGLGISDASLVPISFNMERSTALVRNNVLEIGTGNPITCTLPAPYIEVHSIAIALSTVNSSDNHAYVALSGMTCDGSLGPVTLEAGALLMRQAPSSSFYVITPYNQGTQLILEGAGGVTFTFEQWKDAHYPSDASPAPALVITIGEYAKNGYDNLAFAAHSNGANSSFNEDVSSSVGTLFKKNFVSYSAAGPVINGSTFMREGGRTERGSIFSSVDDTNFNLSFSPNIPYSVFYVGPSNQ